jgi:uncharacterized GH25 family protein
MGSPMKNLTIAAIAVALWASLAVAHDTWVQTNTNIVRVGDVVHVDLLLGNHGNEHRDFKLASKVDPANVTLTVTAPDGKVHDLKPSLADLGYAPKEGYWTTKFIADKPGLYTVAQTSDAVVSYAPTRSIKSGKTYFVASKSLDTVPEDNPGFDKPLGHALELVPLTNPVTPMGPGTPLKVKLLFKGKPVVDETISFIPRGQTLKEGFDERFERKTIQDGVATFEPKEANYYLIVAHRADDKEAGEGYTSTKYSATMSLYVPAICPCCGE